MYQGILFIFHAERSLIFETVVENLIGVTRKLMDLRTSESCFRVKLEEKKFSKDLQLSGVLEHRNGTFDI